MKREKRTIALSAAARDLIQAAMDEKDWTQTDLEAHSGVQQSRISAMLHAQARLSKHEVEDLCRALDLEPGAAIPELSRTEEGQKRAVVGLVIDLLEECLPALPLPDLLEWGRLNGHLLKGQLGALTARQVQMLYAFRHLDAHVIGIARRPAVAQKDVPHGPIPTPSD
jgi:hypothetical protein